MAEDNNNNTNGSNGAVKRSVVFTVQIELDETSLVQAMYGKTERRWEAHTDQMVLIRDLVKGCLVAAQGRGQIGLVDECDIRGYAVVEKDS